MASKNFTIFNVLTNSFDTDNTRVITFSHVLYDNSKNTTKPIGIIAVQYELAVLEKIIEPVS